MAEILVSPQYRTLVHADGRPVWLADSQPDLERGQPNARRVSDKELDDLARQKGYATASIRALSGAPHVARAVAALRQQETHRYDPLTGLPLRYDGDVAHTQHGQTVFPRIDPAVIGIVELRGQSRILLARNRLRPQYFSLVAGYVGLGETLEETFAREVLEETGRRVAEIRYMASQPWPMSGSLMMGFHSFTDDEAAVAETDDELEEIRWASATELAEMPLAAPGSIAHRLITDWAAQKGEQQW